MASPKNRCQAFVGMPFREECEPVYHKVIKPVLETRGILCIRADEIRELGTVVGQIRESIEAAHFAVFDLTGLNPNVLFELGLASALGTRSILMSQNPADAPFDVRHMRMIPYDDTQTGLVDLRDSLSNFLTDSFDLQESASEMTTREWSMSEREVEIQRKELFSQSMERRRYAVKFLGDCQDKASFETIQRITDLEIAPDLTRDGFTALWKIDPDRAYSHLIEEGLRNQKEYLVRERVVQILGRYKPTQELLNQMIAQSRDTSWGVRKHVCEVLGRWREPMAEGTVYAMQRDPETQVQLAAREAMERLADSGSSCPFEIGT